MLLLQGDDGAREKVSEGRMRGLEIYSPHPNPLPEERERMQWEFEQQQRSDVDIHIRTESGERSAASRRRPLHQFRNAALFAFAGSIVANVMILTVFGIPLAMGWHFGLGWLCLAWAVLGVGPPPVRAAVGSLVWLVGLVPLLPVAISDYGFGTYGETLAAISFIAVPTYIVFWIFRSFCGGFKNNNPSNPVSAETVRSNQITLKYLFCLTSICAVLIGVATPVAPILFQPGNTNFLMSLLFVPGVLFLPMLFRGKKGRGSNAFKHLLLHCSMTVPGVLASLYFFWSDPGDALLLAFLFLLIFFAAGATVIGGLTLLDDWGYRIGQRKENPQS